MFRKKKTEDTEKKITGIDKLKDDAEKAAEAEARDAAEMVPIDKKGDKIFGNDYNQGNLEYENFSELKVDTEYSGSYLDNFYNSEEYTERKEMDEKILEMFEESRWSNFSIRKKFPKDHLPHIFNYLRKGLEGQGHTATDMFIAIAEFLDVNYEKLYELIGVKYKEEILIELEKKYKVLSSKKEKRLF